MCVTGGQGRPSAGRPCASGRPGCHARPARCCPRHAAAGWPWRVPAAASWSPPARCTASGLAKLQCQAAAGPAEQCTGNYVLPDMQLGHWVQHGRPDWANCPASACPCCLAATQSCTQQQLQAPQQCSHSRPQNIPVTGPAWGEDPPARSCPLPRTPAACLHRHGSVGSQLGLPRQLASLGPGSAPGLEERRAHHSI